MSLNLVFWIFGVIAMVSALLCITRKNPISSALWLVVTLFAVAALFVLLDAQFLAVLQVHVGSVGDGERPVHPVESTMLAARGIASQIDREIIRG